MLGTALVSAAPASAAESTSTRASGSQLNLTSAQGTARASSGLLKVGDPNRNLCLDAYLPHYNDGRNGGQVHQRPCNATKPNQQWTFTASGEIKAGNGKCLDIHRPHWENTTRGGWVTLWNCNGWANQKWDRLSNGQIKSRGKNLCLDVHWNHYVAGTNGGKVQVWNCYANNINQKWTHVGASQAQTRIAVLGDSYASGEGIVYDNTSQCHRHHGAYGPSLARQRNWNLTGGFLACSGATTRTLLGIDRPGGQIDQLASLRSDTDVILLSIGGNDMGFEEVLKACATYTQPCNSASADVLLQRRLNAMGGHWGQLAQTYRAVLNRAPNAKLYVVNYPMVMDTTSSWPRCSGSAIHVPQDAVWMDQWNIRLNATIANSVARVAGQGYDIELVNVQDLMLGTCQSGNYIRRYNVFRPLDTANFHPTQAGYNKLLGAVSEVVR